MSDESTERGAFEDEIEHGVGEYTAEELLELAQLNTQAMILGTVEILGAGSADLDTWLAQIASIFLRAWDLERQWSPAEILDAVLTNLRAFGATVENIDLEAEMPSALILDFPSNELIEMLSLRREDADQVFALAARIAHGLGGHLDWRSEGDAYMISTAPTAS